MVKRKVKLEKRFSKLDISKKGDLSFAVASLISLEEHLTSTYMKTKKEEYLVILNEVRKTRIKLLKELIGNVEGEIYCSCKHALSTFYRLIEVGTKELSKEKNPEKAREYFNIAFDVYSLFWFLQKIGETSDVKKTGK